MLCCEGFAPMDESAKWLNGVVTEQANKVYSCRQIILLGCVCMHKKRYRNLELKLCSLVTSDVDNLKVHNNRKPIPVIIKLP